MTQINLYVDKEALKNIKDKIEGSLEPKDNTVLIKVIIKE